MKTTWWCNCQNSWAQTATKPPERKELFESMADAPSAIADAIEQCALEAGERSPEGVSSHTMLDDMRDERILKLRAGASQPPAPTSSPTEDVTRSHNSPLVRYAQPRGVEESRHTFGWFHPGAPGDAFTEQAPALKGKE